MSEYKELTNRSWNRLRRNAEETLQLCKELDADGADVSYLSGQIKQNASGSLDELRRLDNTNE